MWKKLCLSIFWVGVAACICGFLGFFYWPIAGLLLIPAWQLFRIIQQMPSFFRAASRPQRIFILILSGWWILHFLQVFVPETGYDAVWYHLPVAKIVVNNHRFTADPHFYQTFNPLFADSIFFLGYLAGAERGAKFVAYGFGLTLIIVTYGLSRKFLHRTQALAVCALVSGFQVVSWQSASFYIDVAKAVFELAALAYLLERQFLQAGYMLGASFASKLFSVALTPVFLWLGKRWQVLISLLFLLPFLGMAYAASGNPIYSLTMHSGQLLSIHYLTQQTLRLPSIFFEIGLTRDYTHPILLAFFPLFFIHRKKLRPLFPLLLLGGAQVLLWWYVPPQSTRYALSGFICLTIATVWLLQRTVKKPLLLPMFIIFSCMAFPIRLVIAKRSMEFLLGRKNTATYLQQFLDGNIDAPLKSWYESH